MRHLRRLLALLACLMLLASTALAEGMRFRLQAEIVPDDSPAADALAQLLAVTALEGTLVTNGDSFDLNASLLVSGDRADSQTDFRLWGTASHWGLRSDLLGDTELMINCAALLPFGQKASEYLDLPLDAAALLAPYTHVDALSSVMAVAAPLFPQENGKTRISRDDLDAIMTEILRLCDEDPALYRYLEVTGLYDTVMRYGELYFKIPELLLSVLVVKRNDGSLIWSNGLLTILNIEWNDQEASLDFNLYEGTRITAEAAIRDGQLTGEAAAALHSLQADAALTLPAEIPGGTGDIALTLTVTGSKLDGLNLSLDGEMQNGSFTLRQIDPQSGTVMLTLTGEVQPWAAEARPNYTPDDLTGMNILSVNSDSLIALLGDVKWPLLTGLTELVAAAPAPAVQSLMDWAEDSGLIDLLADALSGGTGY